MSSAGSMPLPVAPQPLREGDAMETVVTEPFTRTDFVRYAGSGGDFHPIHHDEEFARAAGMPTVFGMGMLHAGMLGVALAHWVGPDNIRSFGTRFTGQVWPGDVLTFDAQVVDVTDGLATIELSAVSQKDEPVLKATATAVVVA
ncbi:MAG TPA: MaoC/PaaZ C-terminal domain-containing protein [Solirubrobacterales bacterium]|nr:MaoC/PaaZ C-terminal domain-containing protein [Solirubrobacterales bacterium]